MSDLQRSFARAKLAGLPPMLPESFDEEEEETDSFPVDDDSSSASSASSTGTIRPTPSSNLFARPIQSPRRNTTTRTPIPWTTFFERELFLPQTTASGTTTHHVYLTSPSAGGPLFYCHHGAGSSGLSFACLALEIKKLLPHAGILAPDARSHGLTHHIPLPGQPSPPLSLETLSADALAVLQLTQASMSWPSLPPLILIGHSLGGAVATSVAYSDTITPSLLGLATLDIVEGSAIDALAFMSSYLNSRPTSFPSLDAGITWHIRSGTIRNPQSARVSVPSLLRPDEEGSGGRLVWRTDLNATEPFWEGWFAGLSRKFIGAKGGKLLILAGADRLDKEMMIAQMQGKYALQVFPEAGHFLHEDQPEKTANVIVDFYRRNDRSALVLPPKVSDLLKKGMKV